MGNTRGNNQKTTPAKKGKQFKRSSNLSARKGTLASAQKKKEESMKPRVNAIGHKDGTLVFIAEKTKRNGDVVEYFSAPIQRKVKDVDNGTFREAAGIDGVGTRRGPNGVRMPKEPGSVYGWNCFFAISENGSAWTEEELKSTQEKFVDEWNRIGMDPNEFEFFSAVVKGTTNMNGNDVPTLDQTLLDGDIIDIIKVCYDIENDTDLLHLADDEDIVLQFFSEYEAGKKAILDFFTKAYPNHA